MFGKKKKEILIREVDDSRMVVNDFMNRNPYWGYRNCEYSLDPLLDEKIMVPILEEHLNKLFEGSIDSGNADVLEHIIFDAALMATKNNARRHISFKDMNCQFMIRRKADIDDFTAILDNALQEEKELTKEREVIERMLSEDMMEGRK